MVGLAPNELVVWLVGVGQGSCWKLQRALAMASVAGRGCGSRAPRSRSPLMPLNAIGILRRWSTYS